MSAKLFSLIFAVMAALLVFSSVSNAETPKDNYAFYCAQCHGLEGRGDGPNATERQPVEPRDHTSAYEMSKLTDQELIDAISGGGAAVSKSTLMPPFEKTLTRQEILELKDYLRKMCDCKANQ